MYLWFVILQRNDDICKQFPYMKTNCECTNYHTSSKLSQNMIYAYVYVKNIVFIELNPSLHEARCALVTVICYFDGIFYKFCHIWPMFSQKSLWIYLMDNWQLEFKVTVNVGNVGYVAYVVHRIIMSLGLLILTPNSVTHSYQLQVEMVGVLPVNW